VHSYLSCHDAILSKNRLLTVYHFWYILSDETAWGGTVGYAKENAVFYRTQQGKEPVRDFIRSLAREDKRIIGADIATVEFGWPVGKPTCAPLGSGLWEIRSDLTSRRIVRACCSCCIRVKWCCCMVSSRRRRRLRGATSTSPANA